MKLALARLKLLAMRCWAVCCTPTRPGITLTVAASPTVVLSADGKDLALFMRANRDWIMFQMSRLTW